MIRHYQVMDRIKARINRVLLVAESSLPERQFRAYRKVVLDEFGKSGLERELEELFQLNEKER